MISSDSRLPDDYAPDVERPTSSDRLRVVLEITVAALILTGIYYLFAPEEKIVPALPLNGTQIDPIIRAEIDSSSKQALPAEKQNETTQKPPVEVGSSQMEKSTTENKPEENFFIEGGSARALISRLRSGETTYTPEQILTQVSNFQNDGKLTDAYLLLFYAAREGDGKAAFSLADMHDPNHFSEGNPLLEKPDPYQSHKWYSAAADKGITEAHERLRMLRKTTEEQAKKGDLSAQRLLLNWR